MAYRAVTMTAASASPAAAASRAKAASADSASATRPSSIRATNRQNWPCAFAPVVAGRPGQVDDLGPGRQPGFRAGRVPQRVQPGVEDLGQRARVPGQPGQPERLVGQRPPPQRGRGVAEQLASQPGQYPSAGGVVPGPFGRQLEQPDQVRVHVEERRGRRRPQRQVDDGVLVSGEVGQLSRQGHGRPRQAA